MDIEDFNSADTVLYEKLMRIQEHITDTIKEYGSISQFKEDVLYVMKCLLERQLNSAELTATETLLKNMEYNIQKQKEEKYEEYIAVLKTEAEKKEAIINEMAKDIKSADEFLDSMGYMGEYAKFTIEEIIEEYERIEKF